MDTTHDSKPGVLQRIVGRVKGAATTVASKMHDEPILVLFVATFAVVAFLQPVKIGLTVWGVSKLALFAWLGDWIDRKRFPEAQPQLLQGIAQGTAWKRKAAIMCVSMVCGALMP